MGGRGLGLCHLRRPGLDQSDLDRPRVGKVVDGGLGLARSTLPGRRRFLPALASRLPGCWRSLVELAGLGHSAGRIVFCTQRPSLLLNSGRHACRLLGLLGETGSLVPCLGLNGPGRGSPPLGRR